MFILYWFLSNGSIYFSLNLSAGLGELIYFISTVLLNPHRVLRTNP